MSSTPDPASYFEEGCSKSDIEGRDPKTGQFLKGVKGVGGRKRGSRAKLAEAVFADVLESWTREGPAVLARLAFADPAKYADFTAKVLPREIKIDHSVAHDISDDRLEELIAFAEHMSGVAAKVIEGRAVLSDPRPAFDTPTPTPAEMKAEALRRDLADETRRIEGKDLF